MPMPVDMLVALTWLAVVSAITPGPNNEMVASSGANFLVIVGRCHIF